MFARDVVETRLFTMLTHLFIEKNKTNKPMNNIMGNFVL